MRAEAFKLVKIIAMIENLQIENSHFMASGDSSGADALQTDWFEADKHLAYHQAAGMNQKDAHCHLLHRAKLWRENMKVSAMSTRRSSYLTRLAARLPL